MGTIPIDSLEAGMVLARDIHDRNGRLLLGAGATLAAKHLMIFRTWGVEEADIEGVESVEGAAALPAELSTEALAEAEKSLEPLFMHANREHPFVRELLRLAAIRKVCHGLS